MSDGAKYRGEIQNRKAAREAFTEGGQRKSQEEVIAGGGEGNIWISQEMNSRQR